VLEDGCSDHRIEDHWHVRGLRLARAQTAERALGGYPAHLFGGFQPAQSARYGEPIISLHRAVFVLRNGNRGNRAVRPAIFADETVRVGENLVAGGGVERSAFGILDAGIEIECSFFGAAGVVDSIWAGQGIHVFVVKVEIAFERAELRRVGNPPEWIFGCDLGKLKGGLDHAVKAGGGEIAGMGAGCALSIEDSHADRSRSGFLQRFDLAQADQCREFVAFADYAFGGGCAAAHGAADDVLG